MTLRDAVSGPPAIVLTGLLVVGTLSARDSSNEPVTFESACADIPGCEAPAVDALGEPMPIWRVLVERDEAGEIRIGVVEEVDVASGLGPPGGPLDGHALLAALDEDGEVLESQVVRFPETLRLETMTDEPLVEDLADEAVDAIGYLTVSDEVAALAVLDADGGVLDEMTAPDPGEARVEVEPQLQDKSFLAAPCVFA